MKATPEQEAEKIRVRSKVEMAIKKGLLVRLPCEVCQEPKSHAHHFDYSKPYDVKWLCVKHHMELHHKKKIVKKDKIVIENSKKQQIIELYEQKKWVHPSLSEIASKVGVFKSYVWKVIQEYKNTPQGKI